MSIFNRAYWYLDRLVGLDQLKQAVRRQDAAIDKLTGFLGATRSELTKALDRCEAKDVEIARLTRELDGARGACDRLQAQADRVSQANLVLTADNDDLKHVIDQCEADRNSLAKERDQAKAEAERHLKAAVNLDDARRAEVERNDSLAVRIANAVDQLTGPRGFSETKPVEAAGGRDQPVHRPDARGVVSSGGLALRNPVSSS